MPASRFHRRMPAWPWPGAAIDLDFIRQRYFWGGAPRNTSEFTTYSLATSVFSYRGLEALGAIDVTVALAGLGTFVPGAFAYSIFHTGSSGGTRRFFQLDDGTNNERVAASQSTTPEIGGTVIDGGASQASNLTTTTSVLIGVRHGFAMSYDTNSFLMAVNGSGLSSDLTGTLPTVTTLRIGREVAGNPPTAHLARAIFFTAVKTQAEVNLLSLAMRETP